MVKKWPLNHPAGKLQKEFLQGQGSGGTRRPSVLHMGNPHPSMQDPDDRTPASKAGFISHIAPSLVNPQHHWATEIFWDTLRDSKYPGQTQFL